MTKAIALNIGLVVSGNVGADENLEADVRELIREALQQAIASDSRLSIDALAVEIDRIKHSGEQ